MDAKRFREKTTKVDSASNINLQDEYVDPRYTVEVPSPAAVTATGHLVILRLNPKRAELPSFEVRWDEKQNTVDVDLIDIGGTRRTTGFEGHHPESISNDPRVIKISIQLPAFKIYEALLTLNVNWGVSIGAVMQQMDGSVSCEVLPQNKDSLAHRLVTRLFQKLGGLK